MIVAIYARFSSVADLEKTSSIEAQIEMCKQKAVENGSNYLRLGTVILGERTSTN